MFAGLPQDIRYAVRGFAKSPLFLAVTVGSIALAIGANAAIFSLMDQILFRPLPVAHPDRLVMLDLPGSRVGATFTDFAFSHPMYRALRDGNSAFEQLLSTYSTNVSFTHRGRSETAPVAIVTGNYFSALGLEPLAGRLLSPEDDRKRNAHPVVVLSAGYFERRFGGQASVIGQTVRINSQPYEVVGVAPRGFLGLEFDNVPSLYVPMAQKTAITLNWDGMEDPNYYFLHVFGVLKPGVSAVQAKANLDAIVPPLIEEELKAFPDASPRGVARFRAKRFTVSAAGTPLLQDKKKIEQALYSLMGIVAFVLLIACANVANLFIARASAREKEIAVRLALGAGQGRLVRQMLVESSLLALLGGALGLLASVWILDAIIALNPVASGGELFLNSSPDWRVAAFSFSASLLTGLLFGLAPAARGARKMIVESLKENTGALASSNAQVLLRKGLVAAQVTISLVLLVVAGLFAKSLLNLKSQNPGFNPEYLLTFRIDPSLNGYELQRAITFLDSFRHDIEAIPGVKDVTVASSPVLSNSVSMMTLNVEGITKTEGRSMNSRLNEVGAGYFRTLGYPLLRGREFTAADLPNSQRVAVVNEEFAKEYFQGNPIGKKIGFPNLRGGPPKLDIEIVGMVRDGKHENMREQKPARFVYLPYTQARSIETMTFYIRSQQDSERLVADVRAALRRADENLSLFNIQSMETTIERRLVLERLLSTLCSAFGLLATLLAVVGLYGVMAYSVARRTREIGIRLALGADRSRVVRMVLHEAVWLLGLGLVVGLPLALALGKVVESQLWAVKSGDLQVLLLAALTLSLVALAAGFFPAWRASRVEPMRALRHE
ncbi:MAG: ABC transporter permease [Bryobacter sp.]